MILELSSKFISSITKVQITNKYKYLSLMKKNFLNLPEYSRTIFKVHLVLSLHRSILHVGWAKSPNKY